MENSRLAGQYPEILTRKQCAEYLSICATVLDRSDIPRIKISPRRVVYRKSDVDAWLESRMEVAE